MKNYKKWLSGAGIVIAAGLVLTATGYAMGGRAGFYLNASGFHAVGAKQGSDEVKVLEKTRLDEFTGVDLSVSYADVEILPADGYYLEYRLQKDKTDPEYQVEDKTLIFRQKTEKMDVMWNFDVSFFQFLSEEDTDRYYVKLYVPEDALLDSVKLVCDSGNVTSNTISIQNLDAALNYGNLTLGDMEGDSLKAELDSGDFTFGNVTAVQSELTLSYGNVKGEALKTDILDAELDSGDFSVKQVSGKDIEMQCDYGNVNIEKISGEKQ
ncbi:MAG: DUF4097 family beta strand repeat-containing protein, partial [Lachnospiraceae bacterium]|nr:DUF4097 family beta strand repeat-containing protein [Lachnospiraceae bacterium]